MIQADPDTITERFARLCVLAVPFAVAVIMGGYGLFGSVISALVVLLAVCGFGLHVIGARRFDAPGPVKAWAAIILLNIIIGLLLFAFHHEAGEPIGNSFNRLSFLCFLPLCAFFTLAPPDRLLKIVKVGTAIGALIVFIFALGEYTFFRNRVWLGAGNPGVFSVVTAVSYCVCTFATLEARHNGERVLFMAGALAALACVLLSGMRSMLPALILIPAIGIVFIRSKLQRRASGRLLLGGILLLAFVVITAGWLAWPRLEIFWNSWEKVVASGDYNTSLGHRIVMWDYALQVIPKHFWLGQGHAEMTDGLKSFSVSQYGFGLGKTHLHNFVATAMVEGGIVGLVNLLLLLLAPLLLVKSPNRDQTARFGLAFMAAVSTIYLLSGSLNILFNHDIMDLMYMSCCALSVALVFGVRDAGRESGTSPM